MENIKIQLKEQYNKSVDFYNKGDFEHYFFHVRKSIELIGKFLIHDILSIKGEEEKAHKIISGESSFSLILRIRSVITFQILSQGNQRDHSLLFLQNKQCIMRPRYCIIRDNFRKLKE